MMPAVILAHPLRHLPAGRWLTQARRPMLPFPALTAFNIACGVRLPRKRSVTRVVLKVVPRSSTALAWRGAAYQGLGNREKAVADYKSALAIDPNSERAIDGLKSLDEPWP
jgi:hypothetical protein